MTTPARSDPQPCLSICFAGDSGDGMQLIGTLFSHTASQAGNVVRTLPDYPAEIRAPAGTPAGVSAFHVTCADHEIYALSDRADILLAFNPAALKVHLDVLKPGGLMILNRDSFSARDLQKAEFSQEFADLEIEANYRVLSIPMTTLVIKSANGSNLSHAEVKRSKNLFALGLLHGLCDQSLTVSCTALQEKFAQNHAQLALNERVLQAGYAYAASLELSQGNYRARSKWVNWPLFISGTKM